MFIYFFGCFDDEDIDGRGGMKLTCGITAAEEKAKVEKEDKVNTVLFFFSFLFKIKKKIVLGFFFSFKIF